MLATAAYGEYLAVQEEIMLIDKKHDRILPIISRFEADIFDTISLVEITARLESVTDVPYAEEISENMRGIREDQDTKKRSLAKTILYNKDNIEAVFFNMPNGDMYLAEPFQRQLELSTNNFSFRDWYRGVTTSQSTYVSELFAPQGKDNNSIAIVTPVRSESREIIGTWGVLMRLDTLSKQFDTIPLNTNERVLLADHNGNLVIDSQKKPYKTITSMLHLDSVNKALNNHSGATNETIDDVKTFTIFMPVTVGTHTWALAIMEPYDDMITPVHTIRFYYAVTLVALAANAVVLSRLFRNGEPRRQGKWFLPWMAQIEDDSEPSPAGIRKFGSRRKTSLATGGLAALLLVVFILLGDTPNSEPASLSTYFVIQNLRGDTVDTWMNWRLPKNEVFHIHVVRSPELTDHRMNILYDVVYSTETVVIDDLVMHKEPEGSTSTYYKGWYGAISSISNVETRFQIPVHFHSTMTDSEDGHIVIRLSNLQHGDGYAGYTKLFADEQNHQILKATITIYDVDRLSDERFAAILRHEMGHGFGLAHSTDPDDLMHPEIKTPYPYISECAINALVSLYDGATKGQMMCEK